jgi:ATP-dependent DNA helicase UvrD/PcrA
LARSRRCKPADNDLAPLPPLWRRSTARLPVIIPLIVFPAKGIFDDPVDDSGSALTMTIPYLEKLNPQQRHAVEHGGSALAEAGPLLIIAGAGSGKTNTLAHRVAHLIVNGADPHRVMLLTFSRRAAGEMIRRVERIVANVMRERAAAMTDAIVWAGTFHAVGARLLREYADAVGLDRAFTIHDREDSADLMNLVRHDLGFSKTTKRFPMKGTCLAIYSRTVNAELPLEEVLGSFFPWCVAWEAELRRLFSAYVVAKQQQHVLDYDDLLLFGHR